MWNYIPRLPESSLCTSKIRVLKKPLLKDAIKTHTILGRHNTLETGIMDRWAVGWGVFSRHLQYPLQGSLVSPVLGILAILGGGAPSSGSSRQQSSSRKATQMSQGNSESKERTMSFSHEQGKETTLTL